jgi:serine/threonine protein kinase
VTTLASGQVVANRYRLLGYLGSGGMGDVWRAQDLDVHEGSGQRALKFIHGSQARNPQLWERFEHEGRQLSGLKSRHVVQVFGCQAAAPGKHEPFVVMELLHGRNLRQRLDDWQPMSLSELRWIMEDAGAGLRTLHERGVVHRDLKPENIFLVSAKGGQYATVLDSGVSMVEDGRLARPIRPGSACYLSPEYLRNPRAVDIRTDVWSLGMIAFECLLRTLPFASASREHTIAKLLTAEPLPEPSTLGQVPAGFDAWFQRACSHDRDKRFQTVSLALEALRQICRERSDLTNLLDLQRDEIDAQVEHYRRELERMSKLVRELEAKQATLQSRCARSYDELRSALQLLDDAREVDEHTAEPVLRAAGLTSA